MACSQTLAEEVHAIETTRAKYLALGIYALGFVFCFTPWSSPGIALALGLAFALTLDNPYREASGRYVRYLLQVSVVLLGFGMDLASVFRVGMHGLLFAAVTIFATFTLGYWLAKLLDINRRTSLLISAGTAICGGSAIAAVGTAVDADRSEMSVAMGTVFLLNAVALYLFPVLGHLLGCLRTSSAPGQVWPSTMSPQWWERGRPMAKKPCASPPWSSSRGCCGSCR